MVLVWIYATNDECAYLACRSCGQEFLSDQPGSFPPAEVTAGDLAMALTVHEAKHALADDQGKARGTSAQAIGAALAELRRVISESAGR